ncbi:hypothetical protein [Cupriavidus sp. UYPR2.512]|uniref:hypothetical protein n=1 Tax=Cupriavidus sp. UYPR2.512 TaxID=1080187 RepID=UPI00047794CE|nr:hypothetical protein [Cupriavidus sp. UYPR2.512]UIF88129.1 hypothetical protein KAF44_19725 [Cupriavidus necator]
MNRPRTGPSWQDTTIIGSLHFAFELGERNWKLSLGDGVRARSRCTVAAIDTIAVFMAIAKPRCAVIWPRILRCVAVMKPDATASGCIEEHQSTNLMMDSASIEMNERC